VLRGILDGLIQLELQVNHTAEAIAYLKELKVISPNPGKVQERIDQLSSNGNKPAP
jgi:hypothetical protein